MQKLKIAIICGELLPQDLGGAEIHIVEVIRGLARKDHQLHVFVGDKGISQEIFKQENIHIHPVSYAKIPNLYSFTYMLSALKQLKKFLREQNDAGTPVDILHAKAVFPYAFIGARLSKKFKLPLYVTVQNPLAHREELVIKNHLLPKFVKSLIQKSLDPFARYGLKQASVLAPVSTYSQDRSKDFSNVRSQIVPNGVDTSFFRPEPNQPDTSKGEPFTICTTSTLIPRNGIDTLIQGFALFHKTCPESQLLIAGEGPLKPELDREIARLEIGQAVKFLGTISHAQVPPLLNRSHLFVRPSRAEGFGVSFVEAMACRLPVITCPSGGIVDFVKDRETGMLVPPNDPQALAEAMITLQKDQDLLAKISQNAYQMVKAKYNWQKITDDVESLYCSLIKTT
jgi:glycosyltransferase involved in cell wall biosynthesis